MIVQVECRPGHLGEPVPHRLYLGPRQVELLEILDWWPGVDHRYFKAKGEDGATYILRHDLTRGDWELTMYESASRRHAEAATVHPRDRTGQGSPA